MYTARHDFLTQGLLDLLGTALQVCQDMHAC